MAIDFPAFRPHPLVRGGHLQTIVGNYWPCSDGCQGRIHHVRLPDGDAIAVHDDGGGDLASMKDAVLLVHGLGGCYQSAYMLRSSAKLRARGFRVFRMDLRGCGAGVALARLPLHAGRSEDAAAVVAHVHAQIPHAAIHVVGFSMGANIVLKMAGEMGENAPPYLASVLAVSPPIDLLKCSEALQRGFNQAYDPRFVRLLVKHIHARNQLVPDACNRPLIPRPRRLVDFDSLFTAPLSGFADVNDYYAQASSGPVLRRIAVPTLIIAAATDPIVPVAAFEQSEYSPTTQVLITPCGGHLGYIAAGGIDADRRWIDWRVVDWVRQRSCRTRSPVAHQADERAVEHAIAGVVQLNGAAS